MELLFACSKQVPICVWVLSKLLDNRLTKVLYQQNARKARFCCTCGPFGTSAVDLIRSQAVQISEPKNSNLDKPVACYVSTLSLSKLRSLPVALRFFHSFVFSFTSHFGAMKNPFFHIEAALLGEYGGWQFVQPTAVVTVQLSTLKTKGVPRCLLDL